MFIYFCLYFIKNIFRIVNIKRRLILESQTCLSFDNKNMHYRCLYQYNE